MSGGGDKSFSGEPRPQPKRGFADIGVRTLSAVVLACVVLALTWVGGWPFRLLAALIAALIFQEWVAMAPAGRDMRRWIVPALALAIVLAALLAEGGSRLVLGLLAAGAVLSALAGWFAGRDLSGAAGLLYAALSGIALAFLRGSDRSGLAAILFLFAIVWAADILAYFAGRLFGGRKLAPTISPGKTWSGAIVGAAGGTLAGLAAAAWAGIAPGGGLALAVFGLSVFSQIGDLFESGVKRRFGVKDSGHIIPGHGGVMDRADALVAAAFALYVVGGILAGFDQPAHALFRP